MLPHRSDPRSRADGTSAGHFLKPVAVRARGRRRAPHRRRTTRTVYVTGESSSQPQRPQLRPGSRSNVDTRRSPASPLPATRKTRSVVPDHETAEAICCPSPRKLALSSRRAASSAFPRGPLKGPRLWSRRWRGREARTCGAGECTSTSDQNVRSCSSGSIASRARGRRARARD